MSPREEYFARVQPILGDGLRHKVVSASRLDITGHVLELLASCMLEDVVVDRRDPALERLLAWKNGFTPVRWRTSGDADLHLDARVLSPGRAPHVACDAAKKTVTLCVDPTDRWATQETVLACARQARDLLMGHAPWPQGSVFHGHHLWPFAQSSFPAGCPSRAPEISRQHVMVVGCGSVGSEAVRLLQHLPLRWTLVDGATVSIFNPQRQWFGTEEIGQPKVLALARRLADARGVVTQDVKQVVELCHQDPPDLVVLSAGTSDHGPLAEALWALGIPHVAACAYPQARFFEVAVVVPTEHTPCLHCFRGHLYRGAEAAPPIRDDVAQLLYRDISPAERDALYVNLVAEPATRLETGRVAQVAARCAAELLAPAGQRGAWMRKVLDESTTCLVGGNVVEADANGSTAYGITFPGQVVRLGIPDVAGSSAHRVCSVCQRTLLTVHADNLPGVPDADVDAALLA